MGSRPESIFVRQRRERIVRAAQVVVARDGLGASVAQIVAEAGAGVSVFYRVFASKDDLLDHMASERVEAWEAIWRGALADEDPGAGLRRALWAVGEMQSSEPMLGHVLRERALARPELLGGVRELTERVLSRAQEAGAARQDIDWNDVTQFYALLLALPADAGDQQWRRQLTLFIDSLRPERATPLP